MAEESRKPLAARMRPRSLDDVVGHEHALDELSTLTGRDKLPSLIFWGPAGCGKTTIARLLADAVDAELIELSATSAGVSDIREARDLAEEQGLFGRPVVLFVDEVHRFNKAQQDALLPMVEEGVLTFIGATTENPSFEVISPLMSRCRLFVLEALDEEEILRIVHRALDDPEHGLGDLPLKFDDDDLEKLARSADGDARFALNTLEVVSELAMAELEDGNVAPASENVAQASSLPEQGGASSSPEHGTGEADPFAPSPEREYRDRDSLPHLEAEEGIYFVTFRLADSMPERVLEEYRKDRETIKRAAEADDRKLNNSEKRELRRLFSEKIEGYLDRGSGECWLEKPTAAGIVRDALDEFQGDRYELYGWCIMPNHVHAVLQPLEDQELSQILHSWKSYTANQINDQFDRDGRLWQVEYYDHLIRGSNDMRRALEYVMDNPREAGLGDWEWVWVEPEIAEKLGVDTAGLEGRGADGRQDACATDEPLGRRDAGVTDEDSAEPDEEQPLLELKSGNYLVPSRLFAKAMHKRQLVYDKEGEEHFNLISAFIKSVRGSDPDAALYWLARMLEAGEDPLYIARRMIILAAEDIGLGDPNAINVAVNTHRAFHYLGRPEGDIPLGFCAVYLATAPKSNTAYEALGEAKDAAREQGSLGVPLHLRNAQTEMMSELGYGEGYQYPHSFPGAFVEENYLPEELDADFFEPKQEGYESEVYRRLKEWWGERFGGEGPGQDESGSD